EPLDYRAGSAWARVARDHGITRVRIGFDISQLVHEFIVLRRTIQEVVREEDPALGSADTLSDMLEAAIAVAVQAYVDVRDFELRRAQAARDRAMLIIVRARGGHGLDGKREARYPRARATPARPPGAGVG